MNYGELPNFLHKQAGRAVLRLDKDNLDFDNLLLRRYRTGYDGTHQVLTYEDDVNLIGDDIRAIERNADVLLNACKDVGFSSKYKEN